MTFENEVKAVKELTLLMEARNHQSFTLIETAKELLRQSTELDLSNIATEILWNFPEAHTIRLLKDQRTGFEDVVFCGHINDEAGTKIERALEAKKFIEKVLLDYKVAAPDSIVDRVINLREYAERRPSWYGAALDRANTDQV
jgi:hypothetical protein